MTTTVYPFKALHNYLTDRELPVVLTKKLVFGNREQIAALQDLEFLREGIELRTAHSEWEDRLYEIYGQDDKFNRGRA